MIRPAYDSTSALRGQLTPTRQKAPWWKLLSQLWRLVMRALSAIPDESLSGVADLLELDRQRRKTRKNN